MLSLVYRCFVWLSQCFQRIEPTFNNWDILNFKNAKFWLVLKNIRKADRPRFTLSHLSNNCAFGWATHTLRYLRPQHSRLSQEPETNTVTILFYAGMAGLSPCSSENGDKIMQVSLPLTHFCSGPLQAFCVMNVIEVSYNSY